MPRSLPRSPTRWRPSGRDSNYYPGMRRVIGRADAACRCLCRARPASEAAQFIAGAFDIDWFDLVEASFSMVTTRAVAICGRRSARRTSIRPIQVSGAAPLSARAGRQRHGFLSPALDGDRAGHGSEHRAVRHDCRTRGGEASRRLRVHQRLGPVLRTDRRRRGASRIASSSTRAACSTPGSFRLE